MGHPVQDQQQIAEAARQLLQKRIETVIITLGARGAYYATRKEQQMVSAYRVQPVDTTGAGDVFCGALAAALSTNEKLSNAVQFANAAAALATTQLGAQPSAPKEEPIRILVKEHSFQIGSF